VSLLELADVDGRWCHRVLACRRNARPLRLDPPVGDHLITFIVGSGAGERRQSAREIPIEAPTALLAGDKLRCSGRATLRIPHSAQPPDCRNARTIAPHPPP